MTMQQNYDQPSFIPGGLLRYVDVNLGELRAYAKELGEHINQDVYANSEEALEYYFLLEARIEKLMKLT